MIYSKRRRNVSSQVCDPVVFLGMLGKCHLEKLVYWPFRQQRWTLVSNDISVD